MVANKQDRRAERNDTMFVHCNDFTSIGGEMSREHNDCTCTTGTVTITAITTITTKRKLKYAPSVTMVNAGGKKFPYLQNEREQSWKDGCCLR